jgi:hypothetical protein
VPTKRNWKWGCLLGSRKLPALHRGHGKVSCALVHVCLRSQLRINFSVLTAESLAAVGTENPLVAQRTCNLVLSERFYAFVDSCACIFIHKGITFF